MNEKQHSTVAAYVLRTLLVLAAACLTAAALTGSSTLVFVAAMIGNSLLIHRMTIWSTPPGAAAEQRGTTRFSLRGLFALTTLCAVLLGLAVSPLGEFMLLLLLLGPIVAMLCWFLGNLAWWAGRGLDNESCRTVHNDAAKTAGQT